MIGIRRPHDNHPHPFWALLYTGRGGGSWVRSVKAESYLFLPSAGAWEITNVMLRSS